MSIEPGMCKLSGAHHEIRRTEEAQMKTLQVFGELHPALRLPRPLRRNRRDGQIDGELWRRGIGGDMCGRSRSTARPVPVLSTSPPDSAPQSSKENQGIVEVQIAYGEFCSTPRFDWWHPCFERRQLARCSFLLSFSLWSMMLCE